MNLNDRQEKIIVFARNHKKFQNKDIVALFGGNYSRETITRDLSFLCGESSLMREGAGAFVTYSLSKNHYIFQDANVDNYFEISYLERDVRENFNFEAEYFYERRKEKTRIFT